jgi:hypothetical protein
VGSYGWGPSWPHLDLAFVRGLSKQELLRRSLLLEVFCPRGSGEDSSSGGLPSMGVRPGVRVVETRWQLLGEIFYA